METENPSRTRSRLHFHAANTVILFLCVCVICLGWWQIRLILLLFSVSTTKHNSDSTGQKVGQNEWLGGIKQPWEGMESSVFSNVSEMETRQRGDSWQLNGRSITPSHIVEFVCVRLFVPERQRDFFLVECIKFWCIQCHSYTGKQFSKGWPRMFSCVRAPYTLNH